MMRRAWGLTLIAAVLALLTWWRSDSEQLPVPGATLAPADPVTESAPQAAQTRSTSSEQMAATSPAISVTREVAGEAEPGIELRGRITDTDGSAVGGIEVDIESRGFDGEEVITQRTQSNDNGEFVLRDMVPGRQYKLDIRPQDDHAAFSLDTFTTDNASALNQIVLRRIDLVDVDGMIVDTDRSPVPNFELMVRSLTAEYPDRVIRSDSSGYFRLPAFPAGELRIASNASDYYRIKGIELQPDEYRNLTLMIDRGNYHLSGWIGDENGAPIDDVQITLKSAFAIDGYHSFSYRTTVTDANGGFEFSGLGGHRLTLGMYARGYESLIRQHDFESFSDRLEVQLRRQSPGQNDAAVE